MGKRSRENPTIGRPCEIDQEAIKIFTRWVPRGWLPREQKPDIFIDYDVEVVSNGEPTGQHFMVQVKGFEDKDGKKPLSHSFKTKHLKYYLHDCQCPVFLFLINITTTEGYWLFAQKFLSKTPREKLNGQKTLRIRFSADDSIYNEAKFTLLLPEAHRFVRDLHPGSVSAAIRQRRSELERLDPRCSVELSVIDGNEHVVIVPKEPFPFSLKVYSEDVDRWKAFVEKGAKITVTSEEVSFEGLPLFESALKQAGRMEFQIAAKQRGCLRVINCNSGFPEVTCIEGMITSGSKFSRFEGGFDGSPLAVSFELAHDDPNTGRQISLTTEFSLSKWAGQRILDLKGFRQITAFAGSFSGPEKPKIEILADGECIKRGELGGKGASILEYISRSLRWLAKGRWLAERFKVNPPVPDLAKYSPDDFRNFEELVDALACDGRIFWDRPRLELTVPVDREKAGAILSAETPKTLRLFSEALDYNFFGTSIPLKSAEHIFTDMNVSGNTISRDGRSAVRFVGTEKTRQISAIKAWDT